MRRRIHAALWAAGLLMAAVAPSAASTILLDCGLRVSDVRLSVVGPATHRWSLTLTNPFQSDIAAISVAVEAHDASWSKLARGYDTIGSIIGTTYKSVEVEVPGSLSSARAYSVRIDTGGGAVQCEPIYGTLNPFSEPSKTKPELQVASPSPDLGGVLAAPQASLRMVEATSTTIVIEHQGGDTLDLTQVSMSVDGSPKSPKGLTDASFGAGERVTLDFAPDTLPEGGGVNLIHIPTGRLIASFTLPGGSPRTSAPTSAPSSPRPTPRELTEAEVRLLPVGDVLPAGWTLEFAKEAAPDALPGPLPVEATSVDRIEFGSYRHADLEEIPIQIQVLELDSVASASQVILGTTPVECPPKKLQSIGEEAYLLAFGFAGGSCPEPSRVLFRRDRFAVMLGGAGPGSDIVRPEVIEKAKEAAALADNRLVALVASQTGPVAIRCTMNGTPAVRVTCADDTGKRCTYGAGVTGCDLIATGRRTAAQAIEGCPNVVTKTLDVGPGTLFAVEPEEFGCTGDILLAEVVRDRPRATPGFGAVLALLALATAGTLVRARRRR